MRKQSGFIGSVAVALCCAGMTFGQNGTLDQESPVDNASFNGDASSLTWQQQVKAGIDGQLEGFSMVFTGTNGSSKIDVAIGLGDAWSSNIVFTQTVTLQNSQAWQFVNTTSANIQLFAGDTFVIQTRGNNTGMGIRGSHVDPPGDPLYSEPLWLNGQNFSDGGWRLGFRSYMLTGPSECLALAVGTLFAGRPGNWDISGATPNAKGVVVYGFQAGSTGVNGTGGYCATFGIKGVNQNRVVGFWVADGNGNAQVSRTIPSSAKGKTVLNPSRPA